MTQYNRILTLPGTLDFTIYHLKTSYKCSSILLKSISPVIKNLSSSTYKLPSIKGNVYDVFDVIFSTECSSIPAESTNLLLATTLLLDIRNIYEPVLEYLCNNLENYTEFYNLVKELSQRHVPIDNLIPVVAKNIDQFIKFIHSENKSTIDATYLNFFSKLFASPHLSTTQPSLVMKNIAAFYRCHPIEFNDSIAVFVKKYMTEDILRMLIELHSFDLNQIKDQLKNFLSALSNPFNALFPEHFAFSVGVPNVDSSLNGLFSKLDELGKLRDSLLITASTDFEHNHDPYSIVDQNESTYYCSVPSNYHSLTFRLLNSAMKPSGYLIQIPKTEIISWQLDASIDGQTWDVIDQVLVEGHKQSVHSIKNNEKLYSFFRLTKRQLVYDESKLCLSRFELYGRYYEFEEIDEYQFPE